MKIASSCVAVVAIMLVGHDYQVRAVDTEIALQNLGRRSRGASVRGQGRQQVSQRNLVPATTCVKDQYVCEWKSEDFASLKNKYAICVKDREGNFESKCVDAKSAKPGIDGSDTITCGCCETESPRGKGDFKACSSVLEAAVPASCKETKFQCQTGSGKGKGGTGASFCAKIALGKGSTPSFGVSDQCGDP